MSLLDAASLEGFSLAELRDVIGVLVGEVQQLQSDNCHCRLHSGSPALPVLSLRGHAA